MIPGTKWQKDLVAWSAGAIPLFIQDTSAARIAAERPCTLHLVEPGALRRRRGGAQCCLAIRQTHGSISSVWLKERRLVLWRSPSVLTSARQAFYTFAMALPLCMGAAALRGPADASSCFTGQKRSFAICHLRPTFSSNTVYYRVPNPYVPVLLLRSVRGVGVRGQLVQVRRGTFRTFLLPQKLAVVASWQNIDRHHLLAQEAKQALSQNPTAKAADSEKACGLSVPSDVFHRVCGTPRDVYGSPRRTAVATLPGSPGDWKTEVSSAYGVHSGEPPGGVSSTHSVQTGPDAVGKSPVLTEQQSTTLTEAEAEKQTSVRRESARGLFGYVKGYCARFVVDTDRSDPTIIRGKGVTRYDILRKLSEELQLDLVPQHAKLTVVPAGDDSAFDHPGGRVLSDLKQDRLTGPADRTELTRSTFNGKRDYSLRDAAEELGDDYVLRKCGLYAAHLSLPLRHGAVARREFSLVLVSKQEISRHMRAKRLLQKAEALRAEFSLGPDR